MFLSESVTFSVLITQAWVKWASVTGEKQPKKKKQTETVPSHTVKLALDVKGQLKEVVNSLTQICASFHSQIQSKISQIIHKDTLSKYLFDKSSLHTKLFLNENHKEVEDKVLISLSASYEASFSQLYKLIETKETILKAIKL